MLTWRKSPVLGIDPAAFKDLTYCTDLPAAEVIYRMGSRWRQENYLRCPPHR